MRFLVLFRGTLPNFRAAEFQSLVRLVRRRRRRATTSTVPAEEDEDEDDADGGADVATADDDVDDDVDDVDARLEPCGCTSGEFQARLHGDVFQWAELASEQEAREVAARSVLIRAVFRPWGHGADYAACLKDALCNHAADPTLCEPILSAPSSTFKCVLEAFGRSYSHEAQLQKIHFFTPLLAKLAASVDLRQAQHEVWILEDVFPAGGHSHVRGRHWEPTQVFLAMKIGAGSQHLAQKYTLKRRAYIGTTSMDAELAFLMANQALVEPGTLLMDPFVGTGSVLISAAVFGAQVIGNDIDINVLRGTTAAKTAAAATTAAKAPKARRATTRAERRQQSGPEDPPRDENGAEGGVRANFAQYGLPQPLAMVRGDILKSPWRHGPSPWLDAIATDPPYGIREGSRSFREDTEDVPEEHRGRHIPATQRIRLSHHLANLLDFAARTLVLHGRLVFWLPTTQDYREEDLPQHPSFALVANTEQVLTLRFRRRLLTLEKRRELSATELELARDALRAEHPTQATAARLDEEASHDNLAAKVLRQQHRREDRLR